MGKEGGERAGGGKKEQNEKRKERKDSLNQSPAHTV